MTSSLKNLTSGGFLTAAIVAAAIVIVVESARSPKSTTPERVVHHGMMDVGSNDVYYSFGEDRVVVDKHGKAWVHATIKDSMFGDKKELIWIKVEGCDRAPNRLSLGASLDKMYAEFDLRSERDLKIKLADKVCQSTNKKDKVLTQENINTLQWIERANQGKF